MRQSLTIRAILFCLATAVMIATAYAQLGSINGKVNFERPEVALPYCTVRGVEYILSTGIKQPYRILAFYGVPYAIPPIGADRFRPPQSIVNTMDCPNRRVMCRQFGQRFVPKSPTIFEESEDCLHLNIYVPVDRPAATYPVLVYFHGGEFKYGGKDLFRPDYLYHSMMLSTQEMIIVTVNYRLGLFGFLSTDDLNQPGNNGIRDQILALQWIHQNIGLFQGDPNRVTIMGHDAGGVSVGIHMLNQDVSKYFRAAISISGTVFSPWAFEDVPVQQARDYGYLFGCPFQTDQLVECLRYVDANALIQSVQDSIDHNTNRQPYWFRPVIDINVTTSRLFTDFPYALYKDGKNNRVPYLVAGTSREGSLDFYLHSERVKGFQELEQKIAYLIRPYLKHYTNEDVVASAFAYKYFNRTHRSFTATGTGNIFSHQSNPFSAQAAISQNSAYNTFSNLNPYVGGNTGTGLQYGSVQGYSELEANRIFSDMLGDYLYLGPMDYAAKMHASTNSEALMFVFDYIGTKSFGPLQIGAPTISRDNYGATHFNDLWYSWLNEYDLTALTGNEQLLFQTYSAFLTQFVLLGTANRQYLRYSVQTPSYITIRYPSTQVSNVAAQYGKGFRTDYFDFVNDFVSKLIEESKIFPPYFPVDDYKVYQTATWSLVGVVILLIVIVVIAAAILFLRKSDNSGSGGDDVRLKRRRDEADPLNG